MIRASSVIKEFRNIQKYEDDIYDLTIVLMENDTGHKIYFMRGLRLECMIRYVIDFLRKHCDKNCCTNLYQSCCYKSDLLLLISRI